MYCTHCGQEIPDNSKFCSKCGQPLDEKPTEAWQANEDAHQEKDTARVTQQEEVKEAPKMASPTRGGTANHTSEEVSGADAKAKGRKSLAPVVIGIVAVIAAVAIIAVVTGVSMTTGKKRTVNLSDYITISFEGYDGYGVASYEFNGDQFSKDYSDKLTIDSKSLKKAVENAGDAADEIEELVEWYGSYDDIVEALSGEDLTELITYVCQGTLSSAEELHNGDEITYTWSLSENDLNAMKDMFGYTFVAGDVSAVVDGLEEVSTFDPFDGVEISFSGSAPDGSAELLSKGSDVACADLTYSLDVTSGLSNGDTVTVTINDPHNNDWVTALVTEYGKAPSQTTKEYTVEGLTKYASSLSEIPEKTMDLMKDQASDTFYAEFTNQGGGSSDWIKDDSADIVQFEYIGCYFLAQKPNASTNHKNMLYLVYKIREDMWMLENVSNREPIEFEDTEDYYWYCRFDDLIILDDGSCKMDLASYTSAHDDNVRTFIDSGISAFTYTHYGFYLYGYQDMDMMYNQLVTSQIDKFTCENTVKDVDFDIAAEDTAEEASEESADTSTATSTEEQTQ